MRLLPLALALLLAACDLPALDDRTPNPADVLPDTPYGHGYGIRVLPSTFFDNMPDETTWGLGLAEEVVHGDSPMDARVASTRAELERIPAGLYRSFSSIETAVRILDELADGDLTGAGAEEPAVYAARPKTEEERRLIGFATELLLENGSYDAHLIAANLSVLRGLWPDAETRAAAAQAAETATRYLVENTRCNEACIETGQGRQLIGPYDARVRLGVLELRALAGA